MSSFLQPDPLVLAFFFVQTLVWFPVLAVLALLRAALAHGLSRWAALLALGLALVGTLSAFAPTLGLSETLAPVTRLIAQMGTPGRLIPSGLLLLAALLPQPRWRWIDALHGLALIGFLGVWWWIS